MSIAKISLSNFMIPAAGGSMMPWSVVASATPSKLDFGSLSLAQQTGFTPQAVKIDNSAGTAEAVLTITNTGEIVRAGAGMIETHQFGAVSNPSVSLTGSGSVNCYFYDFPALPDNGGQVTIAGQPIGVTVKGQPIGVTGSAQAAGNVSYETDNVPRPLTAAQGDLAGSSTNTTLSFTVPVAAGTNIRKIMLSLTEDAIVSAAADVSITVTLGTTVIFKDFSYIPAAALVSNGSLWQRVVDFGDCGIPTGTDTDITIATSVALLGGTLSANVFCD